LRFQSHAEPSEAWFEGLDQALQSLPGRQREAIQLRVIEDRSYDDTAAALGCSPTAARIRVSRALSTLRNALEGGTQ
jgi:RNA polymerase sigma-70 factor (ECF subfamily)